MHQWAKLIVLVTGVAGCGSLVSAHHSRANFQLDNVVEIAGVVTDFKWANPHLYFEIETDSGETWLIEGHSVPGVLGLGWSRDTIEVGDRIRIGANPDLNTNKKFALVQWVLAADSNVYRGFGNAQIPTQILASAESVVTQERRPTQASTDFSGVWEVDLRGVDLAIGVFDPEPDLPLTERGRQVLAGYDPSENPRFQCLGNGLPFTGTYGLKITRHDDRLVMEKEHEAVAVTVWLNPPREAPTPSRFGFATGHLEGDDTLVFEAGKFTPAKWGLSRGVDSSEMKQITARFELRPDGRAIDFTYEISDPVYLTQPLVRTGVLLKQPDREFVDEPCDPAISSLHLNE